MENKAIETIRRYRMIERGDRVVVGVSGGADSMALLHFLHTRCEDLEIMVAACHVNHHLRGEESGRDEQFVRNFCFDHQIPLTVYDLDLPAVQKKHESTEECARRERYRCFGEQEGKIATAHTASDNTETVLLNILRGTGTKGLCGIPPVRGEIIRPLLRCTREDTEDYCKKNRIGYVTDSTNLSESYTRNRIRKNILPALKEFNPSLIEGFSRMTESVYADNAFLEKTAFAARERCETGDGLSCSLLNELEPAILSRVVSMLLAENGIEPSHLRITECIRIILAGKGKINLCRDRFALVRKGNFLIQTSIQHYRGQPKILP